MILERERVEDFKNSRFWTESDGTRHLNSIIY